MKSFLFCVVAFVSFSAQAQDDQWCVWDGQEYIRQSMTDDKKNWLQVVNDLHGSDSSEDVTGIVAALGSCRFLDRKLGATASDVVEAYLNSYATIVATRAYLKVDGAVEVILPKAVYAAGTNQLLVFKDFYSTSRPVCEKQKEEMAELGQQSQGIRFADVSVKVDAHGGYPVILNEGTASSNYLGICYFK